MDQLKMTVAQFVDGAVGHHFVITRSVKGVLRYMADGEGIILYYGDRYDVPDYLRRAKISCWSADCEFANQEYDGSILVVIQ